MTLFTVIFVMFIVAAVSSSQKRKLKIKDYNSHSKSNAKFQYCAACEIAEPMARAYRKYAANLGVKKHFDRVKFWYGLEWLEENKVRLEKEWLKYASMACGYNDLTDESLRYVYSNDIWEQIPYEVSTQFVESWRLKYCLKLSYDSLFTILSNCVKLKNEILNGGEGCYEAYDNKKVIDMVAQEFNTPTSSELNALGHIQYSSLLNLIIEYAFIKTVNSGYSSVSISDIRVNPTYEQRAEQYSTLSANEQRLQESGQTLEIYKKYFK